MYPLESKSLTALRGNGWRGVGPNVFLLGLTSMLTDVSSEMVAAVLPIYFVFALGFSPMQVGLLDGLYQGIAAVARLAGGLLADRTRRNREVAAAGYAVSAVAKLGLIAAGTGWASVSAAIAADRIGKGIRTAPRDALISLSCARERLGLAFGVHRALDTAGALAGPLVALAILAALPNAFDVVFFTSFCIAVIGLAVLLLFVRNVAPTAAPAPRAPVWRGAGALLRLPRFRRLVLGASALAVVTVSDAFLYLLLQRNTGLAVGSFPLLFVGTASTYLLLAVPVGRLGDRIGRGRLFALGHLFLVSAAVVAAAGSGLVAIVVAVGLLGAFYACTDGVLMAAASSLVPEERRASGLAILTTATGIARIVSSTLFGVLWSTWGMEWAMIAFVAAMLVVLVLTWGSWSRSVEVE